MKLINLYEDVQNNLQPKGMYSFSIVLSGGQNVKIENFITGEAKTGGVINTQDGDELEFNYDVEYRGPKKDVVNYTLTLVRNGQEKMIEDADFNLNDQEDREILQHDIGLKLRTLSGILPPEDIQKVKARYSKMLNS